MIVKVCGMRDAGNIRDVEALHPTMMGFICWEGSSRNVGEVPAYLPQCIRVGVFVNPSLDFLVQKVAQLGLGRIQLHGEESPDFCRQVIARTGLPLVKALSVHTVDDIGRHRLYDGICDLLLFDTKCQTVGGSGRQFDWDILQHYDGDTPFLLSGGIGPDDAARVRQFRHPRFLGIDLNSRFETAPGLKDAGKLRDFLEEIRAS